MDKYQASEKFVKWLEGRVIEAARGDDLDCLHGEPHSRFWLGRLAPEAKVQERDLGDRGERLDPCAFGMRLRPKGAGPWEFETRFRACAWSRAEDRTWSKSPYMEVSIPVSLSDTTDSAVFGRQEIAAAFENIGMDGFLAEIQIDLVYHAGIPELTVTMVNRCSTDDDSLQDTNLYECSMAVEGISLQPFELEALPDSFRYNRTVMAYGVNCGIEREGNILYTTDGASAERARPHFWPPDRDPLPVGFDELASDPVPSARALADAHYEWGMSAWGQENLAHLASAKGWTEQMRNQADEEAAEFWAEHRRVTGGVRLLGENEALLRAFQLMNRAMALSSAGRFAGWRPFQLGFLLANLACISDPEGEADTVEVVWFPTGGGKTETYLGLLLVAALYDRITGKKSGITAWSRFPLRMLSLQQTQRFANAIAAAELVRRDEGIPGSPFSLGFFVGGAATPNRVSDGDDRRRDEPDPDDPSTFAPYQILEECPFCHEQSVGVDFDRRTWCLEHRCSNDECPWPERALPFYIVDSEIYRFLPTILVGTLDKAASIAIQAGMRGLIGPPWGKCPAEGHGYTYAPRSSHPGGCLVPGCKREAEAPDMEPRYFAPSFRLQDELHLLKDSLGAVDSHYESLLDSLEEELTGRRPKILASSATLSGYQRQIEILYKREARAFPVAPPEAGQGFWSCDSQHLERRFAAIPPRGVTMEFAVDRILSELQTQTRRLLEDPGTVCSEAGIDPQYADHLVSNYGTHVAYGNTLRDVEAVMRSTETQLRAPGEVNATTLTGKTGFEEVRTTLNRLEHPEEEFDRRIHIIGASSMMSHGVDIDRLNVMVMQGVPLTTAEFIQATARVGRKWPGLMIVIPKIGRERDAGVFRTFGKFVEQGERFLEPIPIARNSVRVLERTLPGLVSARLNQVHEPSYGSPLTTAGRLRSFYQAGGYSMEDERRILEQTLGLSADADDRLIDYLQWWLDQFERNIDDPGDRGKWPRDLMPGRARPMLSLRDVEEQAPIYGRLS